MGVTHHQGSELGKIKNETDRKAKPMGRVLGGSEILPFECFNLLNSLLLKCNQIQKTTGESSFIIYG